MSRKTITDLAQAAGVSIATVDRVLSGRLRVREETARKVYDAAEKIGFYGSNLIRQRVFADIPQYRLGVILRKERHAFSQVLASELELAASNTRDCKINLDIQFASSSDPKELVELLQRFKGRVHAVAATGPDHHTVTEAVRDLKQGGIPTFSLLSDFAQGIRENYIGLNNLKVGRTAAWLISKLSSRAGKVVLFLGGHKFHGHALREAGFRSYIREYAEQFEVLDPLVNLETRGLTYEALSGLLARYSDLVGVYCAGGGMEGAIEAMREAASDRDVVCIVNELTDESRAALLDRTISCVLATPVQGLCADLMAATITAVESGMAKTPGQRFLAPQIWVPDSLP